MTGIGVLVSQILGTMGLFSALLIILRARRAFEQTTLLAAWWWLLAGTAIWISTWVSTILLDLPDKALTDQLWYLTAMFQLCPFIAVLGARKPGSRVWTGFIILPMLFVLGWPAIVSLLGTSHADFLELEDPALVAFALVTLMGVGNYFGTRYLFVSLLVGFALMLIVLPMSVLAVDWLSSREWTRLGATLMISIACFMGALLARLSRIASSQGTPFDRLWNDFRDTFGIVWAKRIQDRINETAVKEDWPTRLERSGFVWVSDEVNSDAKQKVYQQIDHTVRWLLRRFVEPDWIESRIETTEFGIIAQDSSTDLK